MNFIHNKITYPTGGGPTLDDIVDKILHTAKKEQEEDTSKISPINNDNKPEAHSYQEGESCGKGKKPGEDIDTMKNEDLEAEEAKGGKKSEAAAPPAEKTAKSEQECDRAMGKSQDAGKMVDDPKSHKEQGNCEKGEGAVTQQINAEPNYQKGESTDQSKAKPSSKKGPGDPVVGKSSASKPAFKKIAEMTRTDRIKTFAVLAANRHNPREYVEAMVGIKWANLTDKEKEFLRRFWRTMYPDEYVAEMIADR
jgi:hypothetical protein